MSPRKPDTLFRFKQFTIDQANCAMKINTDGVLLGVIAEAKDPVSILDIGTGTGVIALMLAQRFAEAKVDAVEIDEVAAQTADRNFINSPFASRLAVSASGFEEFFKDFPSNKYDLIVSNPPFYTASLKSPGVKKTLAKHSDIGFFEKLIYGVSVHLSPNGLFWLILPLNITETIIELAAGRDLFLQKQVHIHSYAHSEAHRVILSFGFESLMLEMTNLIIYKTVGIYSEEYERLLQPYFIAF